MEGGGGGVEGVGSNELAFDEAGLGVGSVGDNGGELAVEGPSDVISACEDFIVEDDGLVGGGVFSCRLVV